MNKDITNWYIKNRPVYKRLANKVESLLTEVFDIENVSYHIVTSRAKDINSVRSKVESDKYDDPINQIQDFAGIRIITYVEDEVDRVCEIILNNFDIDESNSSNKSDDLGIDKVGYKSVHYVASLKEDRLILPEYQQYQNRCFEIQVRTILQHAWAEIEHDRNYKFSGKLPDDISRRFKLLSGALEMADREFNSISKDIDTISETVKKATQSGELDIPLSSTTLTQFLSSRFSDLIVQQGDIVPSSESFLVEELANHGVNTLADLNKLIPDDIEELYRNSYPENLYEVGMVRSLMIINDYDKYFSTSNVNKFSLWTSQESNDNLEAVRKYFEKSGVDWDEIENKYDVTFAGN